MARRAGRGRDRLRSSHSRQRYRTTPGTIPPPSIAAGIAEANNVGALSVPPNWTVATPAVRPVAMTLPALPQGAPTAAAESDSGGMLSGMALAGMAGRAMAGTVGTGVSRDGKTPRAGTRAPAATKSGDKVVAEDQEPQGKPRTVVTGVAAELREFTKLRDEGILTDEEYTEQKNRLLGR